MENQKVAYFKLRSAMSYVTFGRGGKNRYSFEEGKAVEVAAPDDIRKFRGQKDMFVECDAAGNPTPEEVREDMTIKRPQPLSKRTLGKAATREVRRSVFAPEEKRRVRVSKS